MNDVVIAKKTNTKDMSLVDKVKWVMMNLEAEKKIAFMGSGKNFSYPPLPTLFATDREGNSHMSNDRTANKLELHPYVSLDLPPDFKAVNVKIGGWGSNTCSYIAYMWANPQMNRTFARLGNGVKVDYDISILDLTWHDFELYEEPVPTKELTLAEIEKQLGCKVKIINID